METETIIIVSVFGGAWLLLLVLVIVLFVQTSRMRALVDEMHATGRIRVQKIKLDKNDKNHAFHNPGLVADEELAKRGYSMYIADEAERQGRGRPHREDMKRSQSMYDDEPQSRGRERQTGGQLVDELQKEIDFRQQRSSTAPPFLLQSIEENKRKTRAYNTTGHHSNSNFAY